MNNKPILFLDVDGVLNRCGKTECKSQLEPHLLEHLVRIVKETDCEIVVSSTWRRYNNLLERLHARFETLGLSYIGWTPILDTKTESGLYVATERGVEIQFWMDGNRTPDKFCIVDDGTDMAHLIPHLVKTDSFTGLTEEIANEIISSLK